MKNYLYLMKKGGQILGHRGQYWLPNGAPPEAKGDGRKTNGVHHVRVPRQKGKSNAPLRVDFVEKSGRIRVEMGGITIEIGVAR